MGRGTRSCRPPSPGGIVNIEPSSDRLVFERLAAVLDQELGALRRLLYRMKVCTLHLAGGDARFLARAVDDLDTAQESLALLELSRAAAVADAAAALAIAEDECTLRALVERAPSDLQLVFEGFRNKGAALVGEIEDLRGLSEQVATRAVALVIDRLERVATSTLALTNGEATARRTLATTGRLDQVV
jgi:hypothetical protein